MFITASEVRASVSEAISDHMRSQQYRLNDYFLEEMKELIVTAVNKLQFQSEAYDMTDARRAIEPEWIEFVVDSLCEHGYNFVLDHIPHHEESEPIRYFIISWKE